MMDHSIRLPRARTFACLALGLAACVFGYRGEVEFSDSVRITDLETVQLHLPATELNVTGQPGVESLAWEGRWTTLGGTERDAERGARKPALIWETWESVARLRATIPLELRGITALERLDVQTASEIAHEIVGAGDVSVSGIDAYLSITLNGGNVDVDGGLDEVIVRTTRGDVDLRTAAAVHIESGGGTVHVVSEADGAIVIDVRGPVFVELAQADALDLDIAGAGPIVVQLDSATHVGAGSYRRGLGAATRELRIRSGGGRVELHMIEMPDMPPPNDLPPGP